MIDFRTVMDKLSNGDFRVLIELRVSVYWNKNMII